MLKRFAQLLAPERVVLPDRIEVVHEGVAYAVRLKRSPRARRYSLRIATATREAVLTMPQRGAYGTAADFARRHAGWLAVRLGKLPRLTPLQPGETIPFKGEPHHVRHDGQPRGAVRVSVTASGGREIIVSGPADHAGRRLRDFLRREAKRELELATARHARALGVAVQRVTVKDTVSRWGSCSSKGAISYSWRLILAPPFVLDYLAAHEVAHRVEMNHSARFWAVTRTLFPDMDRAEAWLKRNGASLHAYE
jgi:predicted metal-dependent hydrolase